MKLNWRGFAKSALAALTVFLASRLPVTASQSVSIGWSPSASPDVAGYIVHYGPVDQSTTNQVDVGNVTAATLSNLSEGLEYFFYVTAYNAIGIESDPSNAVQYSVPVPILASIPDQTVQQGQTLTLTASATIGSSIATGVVYSLGAGSPVGVSIDPNTGSLSWTPSAQQVGSANIITVRVAVVGSSTIADSKSFNVVVTTSPAVNQLPIARTDKIARISTQSTKVSVASLLSNDSDPDSDTLTITGVSPITSKGANVTLVGGWIFYMPNGLTNGDSFTYTIDDGHGGTATGTVFVSVKTTVTETISALGISALENGVIQITVNGIPGRIYTVQYADFSTPSNWQVLGQVTVGSLGSATIDDASGVPLRMFRAVSGTLSRRGSSSSSNSSASMLSIGRSPSSLKTWFSSDASHCARCLSFRNWALIRV